MRLLRGLEVPQQLPDGDTLSEDARLVLDYLETLPAGARLNLAKVFPRKQPFSTQRRKAAMREVIARGHTVVCLRDGDPEQAARIFYTVPRKMVLFPEDQPDRPARYWPQRAVAASSGQPPVRVPVMSVRRQRQRRDRHWRADHARSAEMVSA